MVLNIWLYYSKCLFLSSFLETDYFTCQFNWTISFNPYLLRTEHSVLHATFFSYLIWCHCTQGQSLEWDK